MSKNWIQKATKNMRKDKPCTGEKFGSESCPPGSKRYNLAKTFRKMAKEGHKLASLEKASVLSASDDPEDQDKAREIRVRHDYESLKKQIGSKKKPSKPAVEEEVIDETVGGGVPLTPQELEIQKKMSKLNVRLARKRNQQMSKAKVDDTESSPEQVKEGKGYQPEIEHSKLGDAKKKADKKRESKLPPHLQGDAIGKMKKAFSEEDKAFNYVVDKLRKQYGKDSVLTKGQKPKPPTDKQKAEYAAHKKKIAQQDTRDELEKSSQGRYSLRHSNRGSD